MRLLAMIAPVFCATSLVALAAGIDGKWISQREVGDADGKTYAHTTTIILKNTDGILTGTVVQISAAPWMAQTTGRSFEIKDGKIEGDKFSFKVTVEGKNGDRTATYEGTFAGGRLKGIIKFRGIGQTWDLDAKRAD